MTPTPSGSPTLALQGPSFLNRLAAEGSVGPAFVRDAQQTFGPAATFFPIGEELPAYTSSARQLGELEGDQAVREAILHGKDASLEMFERIGNSGLELASSNHTLDTLYQAYAAGVMAAIDRRRSEIREAREALRPTLASRLKHLFGGTGQRTLAYTEEGLVRPETQPKSDRGR